MCYTNVVDKFVICFQCGGINLWHRTQEEIGTPNHTTIAVTHSNKVVSVLKSMSRELASVKSSVTSLTVWKEGVEQQLLENRRDMAAVNKKLDLLLEAIIPAATKPFTGTQSAAEGKGAPSDVEADVVSLEDAEGRADVTTITAAGHDKACSASFMSGGTGAEFPEITVQGMFI